MHVYVWFNFMNTWNKAAKEHSRNLYREMAVPTLRVYVSDVCIVNKTWLQTHPGCRDEIFKFIATVPH